MEGTEHLDQGGMGGPWNAECLRRLHALGLAGFSTQHAMLVQSDRVVKNQTRHGKANKIERVLMYQQRFLTSELDRGLVRAQQSRIFVTKERCIYWYRRMIYVSATFIQDSNPRYKPKSVTQKKTQVKLVILICE